MSTVKPFHTVYEKGPLFTEVELRYNYDPPLIVGALEFLHVLTVPHDSHVDTAVSATLRNGDLRRMVFVLVEGCGDRHSPLAAAQTFCVQKTQPRVNCNRK